MPRLRHNYFESNRASKFIYGIILMFVFVISQGHNSSPSALALFLLAIFASISFAFAEIYSEILGGRIKNRGKIDKIERRGIIDDSMAIVSSGVIVGLIYLFSALNLYAISTAFSICYVVLLCLLFIYSYWAFKLSGVSNFKALVIAVASVLVGLLVIILKYLLGH